VARRRLHRRRGAGLVQQPGPEGHRHLSDDGSVADGERRAGAAADVGGQGCGLAGDGQRVWVAAIANTIAYGPEAGLKAGVFAAAFAFVGGSEAFGELKKVTAERVIAHAVLGCVQQASSGGQCGPGAAAAAFGNIATGLT